MVAPKLKIGLATERLASKPLREVVDWVIAEAPEISGLEIGTGACAPASHCDMPRLLKEPAARRAAKEEIEARGLEHGLFCWQALLSELAAAGRAKTIAIEHEDPLVAPEIDIEQAARLLAEAFGSAARTRMEA